MKLDYNNMLASRIGDNGIPASAIEAMSGQLAVASRAMREKRPQMAWRDLPHNQAEIVAEINAYANGKKGEIEAFVVLGIGGSALGPLAVQQALNHVHYNELSREKRGNNPKL